MRTFILRVKTWVSALREYIWIAVIVYAIHLVIEGVIVNLLWYSVIKPTGGVVWALL